MNVQSAIGSKQFTDRTDTTTMTSDSRNVISAPSLQGKHTERMLKNEERTKCEVWSRVMGYHRPVSHFNIGKKSEWKDRKMFKEPKEN